MVCRCSTHGAGPAAWPAKARRRPYNGLGGGAAGWGCRARAKGHPARLMRAGDFGITGRTSRALCRHARRDAYLHPWRFHARRAPGGSRTAAQPPPGTLSPPLPGGAAQRAPRRLEGADQMLKLPRSFVTCNCNLARKASVKIAAGHRSAPPISAC